MHRAEPAGRVGHGLFGEGLIGDIAFQGQNAIPGQGGGGGA